MNTNFENIMVGETLMLGHYPQGSNGETLPIEWNVLAAEDNRVLVLAKYVLDAQPFHSENEVTRWENCALRQWLNDEFMHAAFSAEEQEVICAPEAAEDPMGDFLWQAFGLETATEAIGDRVFLLSMADVNRYFPEEGESGLFCPGASAECTPYAAKKTDETPCWWLRSSMPSYPMAHIVSPADSIGASMISADNAQGVRPAMWLKK